MMIMIKWELGFPGYTEESRGLFLSLKDERRSGRKRKACPAFY